MNERFVFPFTVGEELMDYVDRSSLLQKDTYLLLQGKKEKDCYLFDQLQEPGDLDMLQLQIRQAASDPEKISLVIATTVLPHSEEQAQSYFRRLLAQYPIFLGGTIDYDMFHLYRYSSDQNDLLPITNFEFQAKESMMTSI